MWATEMVACEQLSRAAAPMLVRRAAIGAKER